MKFENYVKYLKYRFELKKARGFKNPRTSEEFKEYFFGDKVNAVYEKYNNENEEKRVVVKSSNVVKRVAVVSLAVAAVVGFLVVGDKLIDRGGLSGEETTETETTIMTESETTADREYGHKLTQDEVLDLASAALQYIEKDLTSNGSGTMGEEGTPFYPEWFNPKMIATIAYMESSFRATNSDGTPLYGSEITNDYGQKERARGMCQILPSTIDQINYWLKNTMESDLSYTVEDCDNPEKALEICVLINIMNCKNYFDRNEDIYEGLNFKDNIDLQGQCVVASYKYGCGNVHNAYVKGTLFNTYLNSNWKDGDNANYLRRFNEVYNNMDYEIGE